MNFIKSSQGVLMSSKPDLRQISTKSSWRQWRIGLMAETHRAIRIVAQQEPMEVKLGPLSAIDLEHIGYN
jgi:hypothetical protein